MFDAGQQRVSVYPRVCGGTDTATTKEVLLEGLSPRVRGNRHRYPQNGGVLGSIPACAGEPDGSLAWSGRS